MTSQKPNSNKDLYKIYQRYIRDTTYMSDTDLSNELWNIKNNYHTLNVRWEILSKHQSYNLTTRIE